MADKVDEAQIYSELHLIKSLKNIKLTKPTYSGFCLYCDEPVEQRRFCDSSCRIYYERENKCY